MEQRSLRTGVLLLLLAAAALAQQGGDEFARLLAEGGGHFDAGRYQEALGPFARARLVSPGDWRGHTWQALTLLRLAESERDPRRRAALLDEAGAMTGPLVRQAGLLFQDPLRHYLLGTVAAARGDAERALHHLTSARTANSRLFRPYEHELRLRSNVELAYARACLAAGQLRLIQGRLKQADHLLRQADAALPKDDGGRVGLLRTRAAVLEALGRYDDAAGQLRACVPLLGAQPPLLEECRASLARVLLAAGKAKEARAVLEELDPDSRNPAVLEARALARKQAALADPAKLDAALEHYRGVIRGFPDEGVHPLVIGFSDLALIRAGDEPDEVAAELLEEAATLLVREIRLRPKSPAPYERMARIRRLQGAEKAAERFEKLHASRAAEAKDKLRFDAFGRPRWR